jgi:hypothetical protein
MSSSAAKYLTLLGFCATLALPLRSEETSSARQSAPARPNGASDKKALAGPMPPADSKKMPDLRKMDFASLPADAVVVVCERVAEALQLVPSAVVLTPEKYQKMLDEIERLRKLLQTEKPEPPSQCQLKGKIEGNAALLEAHFEGTTDRPNTILALACSQAGAASASLDGHIPHIRRTEAGGYLVQIEKPGRYHLKLDLFVPLAVREGNGRGFELTLPRAAINNLDLELPANVRDVRVGGRTPGDPELAGLTWKNRHLAGDLGTVEKVDVTWKEVRPPSGAPVLLADGDIQVRLDPTGVTTETELRLHTEGAPTNVWRLLVPLKAEVKVVPPDEARVNGPIQTADQPHASLRTIHLKEPSADPLRVQVKTHSPLPSGATLTPIGPFFVVDAARQSGRVVVRNRVHNLHLDFHKHGDMTLRQVTEEPSGEGAEVVAAFAYGNIPMVARPQGISGPNSLSWLDLEGETLAVRGPLRTRVTHTLTLRRLTPETPDGAAAKAGNGSLRWDIVTTVAPATKWTEGENLKILVPPGWTSDEEVQPAESEKNPRLLLFRSSSLLREGATQAKRLQGHYEATVKSESRVSLKLPWPQGTVEQCEVKIEVPHENEVVLRNAELADLELARPLGPHEQTWRWRRVPPEAPALDLSWGPYRPELLVKSVVDLTLQGERGEVRQEIQFHSPQSLPPTIGLRVPTAVGDSLSIVEGGSLVAPRNDVASPRGLLRQVTLTRAGKEEGRLVLHYTTTLGTKGQPPRPGQPFAVPLVMPDQATRGETRVRLWSGLSFLPLPSGAPPWDEQKIEEVKDRSDLPVLVLQAPRVDAPLMLRAGEPSPVFTVLAERALVRVVLQESGGLAYRVSYQVRHLAGDHLDIELPGPVRALALQAALNHRRLTPDVVDENGRQTEGGNIARLRIGPELVRQSALLELTFQLPPGRSGGSPLRTLLPSPLLRDAPPSLPTRWQVSLPGNRVLLAPESAAGLERTLARRGWLVTTRLNRTDADLQSEFEASLPEELQREAEQLDGDARSTPALVCWQDGVQPMVLTHAPKQAWLLICSLSLLIVGLGLFWSARPQPGDTGRMAPWFWPILALAALGAAVGVLFWPTTFWAIVYGCEPGAVVLLVVVGFQWLLHRRYRRQIVFLPSFARGRPGSSLLRKPSSLRPQPGEPSTVDAPPPSVTG